MTDKERLKLLQEALARLEKTNQGYRQAQVDINKHGHWKTAIQTLHALEDDLTPSAAAPKPPTGKVPNLGAVYRGGKPFLDEALTHATGGLPLYPAIDTNWKAGSAVIAPEGGTVTRHSGGGSSGFSLYLTGDSGLKYYFQHMNSEGRAPLGRLKKGGKIGTVGSADDFPDVNVAHNHVGINVEAILGAGKQLKYGETGTGPNYTLGAPTIRKQLEGKS
jgi:hypothetical protein